MIAILDNIRSMHNVGSIFRTSDATGIEKLYLCGFTSAPIDRFNNSRIQISKVALGAEKTVKWEKKKSTIRTINTLKRNGFKIVAIELDRKSIKYTDIVKSKKIQRNDKIALVVGNEIKGISNTILNLCDVIAEIPMYGKKESLNVSVAFGIVASYIANLLNR